MKPAKYKWFICLFILAAGIHQEIIAAPGCAAKAGTKEKKIVRNYERGYTKKERETVSWIVNTLAWGKLSDILLKKRELEKEGKRIQGLHPLRFLEIILTDEKLKCGMYLIRTWTTFPNSRIKDDFFAGITDTLQEEGAADNLKPKDIQNFAQKVKIDYKLIQPLLSQKRWMEFADCLIDTIPRENDPQRYNM